MKFIITVLFHHLGRKKIISSLYCRGTEEFFKLDGSVDIINSTLGKALGGASGGYTTGPTELIQLLRQKSRPYLFSNSLPPVVVGIANKVIFFFIETIDRF